MTVCIIHSSGRSRREEALTEIDCTPPEKLASPHVDFYSTGAARSGEKIRVPRRFQWIWPDDGDSGERVRPARRVWRPAKHNPSNLLGVCGPRGDQSTGSCQAKKWGARRTPRRPGRSRSPALLDLCRNPLETSRNLICYSSFKVRRKATSARVSVSLSLALNFGISLGGWLAGLVATRDARLKAIVLAVPGVRRDYRATRGERVLWAPMRRALEKQKAAREGLDKTPMNLTLSQPVVPKENILLIQGSYDLFVEAEQTEELWQKWKQPEIWRLPHGHMSWMFTPGLTERVLRWLAPQLE